MSTISEDSLLNWYPLIKDIVPVPKTVWLDLTDVSDEQIIEWIDEGIPEDVAEKLKEKAREIGYPLFMRTDLFSAKHFFEQTCYVQSEDRLIPNLRRLLDINYTVELLGLPVNAIVFREYLDLYWKFRAFYGKLPVATEVRWFIRGGDLQCWHFYWVRDAIEQPDRRKWVEILEEMEKIAKDEEHIHRKLAKKVAKVMNGYWSVDFARTVDGKWVCIDMAMGKQSYHPSTCPHLSNEERRIMQLYEKRTSFF